MGMIAYLREVDETARLQLEEPTAVRNLFGRDKAAVLSLEKAWHGLHHLLAGPTSSGNVLLGFLMHGGEEVGPALSYGRVRLFSRDFVQQLANELQGIGEDDLWAHFDRQRFEAEGIYPGIWDEAPDELRDEYVSYFRELRDFITHIAQHGNQLAVVIL